jgi:hypothetical protein
MGRLLLMHCTHYTPYPIHHTPYPIRYTPHKVWDAFFCEGAIVLIGVGLSMLTLAERDYATELSAASSIAEVEKVLFTAARGAVTRWARCVVVVVVVWW